MLRTEKFRDSVACLVQRMVEMYGTCEHPRSPDVKDGNVTNPFNFVLPYDVARWNCMQLVCELPSLDLFKRVMDEHRNVINEPLLCFPFTRSHHRKEYSKNYGIQEHERRITVDPPPLVDLSLFYCNPSKFDTAYQIFSPLAVVAHFDVPLRLEKAKILLDDFQADPNCVLPERVGQMTLYESLLRNCLDNYTKEFKREQEQLYSMLLDRGAVLYTPHASTVETPSADLVRGALHQLLKSTLFPTRLMLTGSSSLLGALASTMVGDFDRGSLGYQNNDFRRLRFLMKIEAPCVTSSPLNIKDPKLLQLFNADHSFHSGHDLWAMLPYVGPTRHAALFALAAVRLLAPMEGSRTACVLLPNELLFSIAAFIPVCYASHIAHGEAER